jgi:hypothetical protein
MGATRHRRAFANCRRCPYAFISFLNVVGICHFVTTGLARAEMMHYLYGSKRGGPRQLVATFGSEAQLLAYVRWATLASTGPQRGKFEQQSALASYDAWEHSAEPLTDDNSDEVFHNPTPSML